MYMYSVHCNSVTEVDGATVISHGKQSYRDPFFVIFARLNWDTWLVECSGGDPDLFTRWGSEKFSGPLGLKYFCS